MKQKTYLLLLNPIKGNPWVYHPTPSRTSAKTRGGREHSEDLGLFFIDFLHKIDDFEAKTSKNFAPAARFPWELYF